MTDNEKRRVTEDFVAAHRLETMRLVFTDLHGTLRGKVFPMAEYLRHVQQGVRFSEAVFARDATGRRVDATHLTFESGAKDYIAIPDAETYCLMPWRPGMGQVLADLFSPDGTPAPYAPRFVLHRISKLFEARGAFPSVASELEFYVVARESYRPVFENTQPYNAVDLTQTDTPVDAAISTLNEMRLPVEALHREAGPGQFEINLRHTTPLKMADYTVLFKNALKEIARKHGLVATFMAKPFTDHAGNGFHLHQSLWDKEGRSNLFTSPDDDGLSRIALQFIGGQLRHLPAATIFFAPTINSYKRLKPESFTPVNCTWGYDNRTTALRVPEKRGSECRIENRVPGADANPYLVIAASLAGGLIGLRDRVGPPESVSGDAYKFLNATPLPRSLRESLSAIAADEPFSDIMGRDLVQLLTTVKRAESEQYEHFVTEWERRTFLDLL